MSRLETPSMTEKDDDIVAMAERWSREGRKVALATVVKTWGSSPRPAGSHLIVDEDENFLGSVSGGCVEAAVIAEAARVIQTGKPKLIEFGVSKEMAWDAGLACGGGISVYIELVAGMRLDLLAKLNIERAACRIAIVVTEIATGIQRLVRENEIGDDELGDVLKAGLLAGKSAQAEKDGRIYFVELHLPTPSMVIMGAVHISQTLAPMARMLGYQVTIIDPRTAFATPERFPDTEIVAEWPDRAFQSLRLDRRTAFIALTHDPKIDDPALHAALIADCFYVGALGSRRTHNARLDRLAGMGVERKLLEKIHGPVGLAIGATTPAEIAVSIMAGVTMALRKTHASHGPLEKSERLRVRT